MLRLSLRYGIVVIDVMFNRNKSEKLLEVFGFMFIVYINTVLFFMPGIQDTHTYICVCVYVLIHVYMHNCMCRCVRVSVLYVKM